MILRLTRTPCWSFQSSVLWSILCEFYFWIKCIKPNKNSFFSMASILHGNSCQSFHHHHSHGDNLFNHRSKSCGNDEMKSLQIDDSSSTKTQSACKSENINVQAAFLHVLGDLIQSIGVIIAAVVIKFYVCKLKSWWSFKHFHNLLLQPKAIIVDPLITVSFSIIVLCTTVKIFKQSAGILLEAVPSHISYDNLLNDLKCIDGVW